MSLTGATDHRITSLSTREIYGIVVRVVVLLLSAIIVCVSSPALGSAPEPETGELLQTEKVARTIERWLALPESERSDFSLDITKNGLRFLYQLSALQRISLNPNKSFDSPTSSVDTDRDSDLQQQAVATFEELLRNENPKARTVLESVMTAFAFDLNTRFQMPVTRDELLPPVDPDQSTSLPLKRDGLAKLAGLKVHLALPRILKELETRSTAFSQHKADCSRLGFGR